MSIQRFYASDWEWGCCGGPLHVGDEVTLTVERDSEYARTMRAELEDVIECPLTGIESHHEDDDDSRERVTGTIAALDGVIGDTRWMVEPREDPGPPPAPWSLGNGVSVGMFEIPEHVAHGEPIPGTSRLRPVPVIPYSDGFDDPRDDEQVDITQLGEQIRGSLRGYLITIATEG